MGTKGTNKTEMLKEYAVITAGIFLTALAVYFFMMPANIVLGSVTGLAIVLVNFIPLQVSAMTFILNVLCLIIGFIFVGKEFGGKTVYTSILLPFFLYVFELFFPNNPSLTGDIILDTLSCIILISIGQSLMFNANASSGGLDILAKVLNKYLHIELGKGIAIIGILTVASTILVYDTKTLVVGVLGTYFNGIVLDEFISGFPEENVSASCLRNMKRWQTTLCTNSNVVLHFMRQKVDMINRFAAKWLLSLQRTNMPC